MHIYPLRPPLTLAKWSVSFQQHRALYPPLHRPFVFDNWNDSRDVHECTPGRKASTANKWPSCELSVVKRFSFSPLDLPSPFVPLFYSSSLLSFFLLRLIVHRVQLFKRTGETNFQWEFLYQLHSFPEFFFLFHNFHKDFLFIILSCENKLVSKKLGREGNFGEG